MDNLRGILLMLGAMVGFALEDMCVKIVSERLPTGEILICLGLCGGAVFSALARAQGARIWTRDALVRPVLLRHAGEITGTAAFVSGLALVPLAPLSAILQAMPLAVTLGAALFLGEPVGWRRWSAIGIGFVGVLLVIRPGLEGFRPASLLGVVAVAALALRDLATRRVPARISTTVLSAYGFLAVAPAGLALLLVSGGATLPGPGDLAGLGAAVVFGVCGYWALTQAMRLGEVAVVTPFRYARLLAALVIASLVFAEHPDAATLWGAAIIIGSGLYTLLRERRAARGRAALSTAGPLA